MIKTKDKFTKDKYFLYKRKYTKDFKNTKAVKVCKR